MSSGNCDGRSCPSAWADAKIEDNAVVLSSPSVPEPVSVRYGWAENPVISLVNGDGLPFAPFRTDDW